MEPYEYASPQQLVKSGHYPFTMGQMRHFLLHCHKNKLDSAVRKIGKRLLLRVDLFEQWIEAQKT